MSALVLGLKPCATQLSQYAHMLLNYFIFSEDKSHLLQPLKIRC